MGDGQSIFSQTLFNKLKLLDLPVNDRHSETTGIFFAFIKKHKMKYEILFW